MTPFSPSAVDSPELVTAGSAPVRRAGPRGARLVKGIFRQRWVSPVLLVILWEICSRLGIIPPRTLAAPSTVIERLWLMMVNGILIENVLVSLRRVALGLGLGILLGVVLATLAGLSRVGEAMVDPLMQIKRSIPTLALTPLFIVWCGIGELPKVLLITFGTVFPIYLNLYNGIRSIDVRLLEVGRTLGLNKLQLIWHIVLPGAFPSFLVGLRFALGVAVLVLVVAETINATEGLGYLVNNARDFMQTDVIVVCIIVYASLGLTGDWLVRRIERAALAWRPSNIAP